MIIENIAAFPDKKSKKETGVSIFDVRNAKANTIAQF